MYGPARSLLAPLLLALAVASCAPGRAAIAPAGGQPLPPPAVPLPLVVGPDRLWPLPDGPDAIAAIREELKEARQSIQLEMYEFQRPDLAVMIMEDFARGVAVTALMDPSERSSRAIWELLRQAGIPVVAFPSEPRTIEHVKLLIVDSERAIVGGINWGRRSASNHDFDLLLEGPVVANLARVFTQDLAIAGQPRVVPPAQPDAGVQVLVTRPGDAIRSAALALVDGARRSIVMEMFDLSDRLVLDSLSAARARGVTVRVLLEPTQAQNVDSKAALTAAGAMARFFTPAASELLHAKLAIVDGGSVLFGSCNWTRSGFNRNHELDLLVRDSRLARIFGARADQDWALMSAP